MRDLKHLIYFENLLQEANNDLVKQAKSDGKLALGYTCYFMPEVLLDLPGCFSVRLRAPRCTSPDMATYYMSSRTCHYGRSLLERALEGGFNFLDAQLATETCTVTCRFQEHLQRMDIIQNERFKCEFMDVPFKKTENSIDHYEAQIKAHVLDFLHDNYGVDTSDEALCQTIESHNELCRIMQAIGDHRKLDVPTITGYEYHVINLVTLACPKYLIIDKLRETLEELKQLRLEGTDEQIPTFDEVLALFESATPLIIELKTARGNHHALAKAVCERLDSYQGEFCIESFDPFALIDVKKFRPAICRGQLSMNFEKDKAGLPWYKRFIAGNLLLNFLTVPDFIAYKFEDRKRYCLRACVRTWGAQEVSWTIRKKEDLLAAVNTGSKKARGALWYNVGRFVYVPFALVLCCVALFMHVSF